MLFYTFTALHLFDNIFISAAIALLFYCLHLLLLFIYIVDINFFIYIYICT